MATVKANDKVRVHYTGQLTTGEIFDTTVGFEPAEFELGQGMLLPKFEEALVGMAKGEKKSFEIGFEDAYGPVNKDIFYQVPKDVLPEDVELEVGGQLTARSEEGEERPVMIAEIGDDHIVVDANHPLAGRNLKFDVEIVEIV